MQRKLLVRTPLTTDGLSPQFDENDKKLYRETILPLGARAGLESINATMPDSLRHKFSEVEVGPDGKIVGAQGSNNGAQTGSNAMTAAEVVKLIAAAETVEAVNELSAGDTRATVSTAAQKRIAELQK